MDPLEKPSPPEPEADGQAVGFFLTWGGGGDPASARDRALLLAKGLSGPEAPGTATPGHVLAEGPARPGVADSSDAPPRGGRRGRRGFVPPTNASNARRPSPSPPR